MHFAITVVLRGAAGGSGSRFVVYGVHWYSSARCGLLRNEQAVMLGLVAASFALILAGGRAPIGPLVIIALLSLILRRDWPWWKARIAYSSRPASSFLGRSAP